LTSRLHTLDLSSLYPGPLVSIPSTSRLTQEREPGEERGGAEAEQRQQQRDEEEGDGVGFTPPVFKGGVRSFISTGGEVKADGGGVPSRVSVGKRTDHW